MTHNPPILWSFRRCPYAIRARMALVFSGITVELREIKLSQKPQAFLAASTSATVPALERAEGALDESLDIMIWALKQNDPMGLLDMPDAGCALIADNDGPFKAALDHTKYAVRYPELDPVKERERASDFIRRFEGLLAQNGYLLGPNPRLADVAIFPFIRQFANIDRARFDAEPWPKVINWLDGFLGSPAFEAAMTKYPVWEPGAHPVLFGGGGPT